MDVNDMNERIIKVNREIASVLGDAVENGDDIEHAYLMVMTVLASQVAAAYRTFDDKAVAPDIETFLTGFSANVRDFNKELMAYRARLR